MGNAAGRFRVLYVGSKSGAGDFAASLADEGEFAVTTVESGADALDLLRTETFDCVVGDTDRGFELLTAVRERWANLPYVFVAAEGSDDADAALSRGATDYLERRGDRDQGALLAARVRNAAAGRVTVDRRSSEAERDYTRLVAELQDSETYLRKLYRVASSAEFSFEQKRTRMLELGRERLGVDIGFVSRIEDDTMVIVDAIGSHDLLQPGESAPLSDTYCRKTYREEGLLSVQDAESEGWADDPAFAKYDLGCYVGAKINVNGDLYGTLCFADRDPLDRTFTDNEKVYVELVSQWLGYELEQSADERALREQNERLEEFASVVSHDLRNPLNVAEIYLNMARESGADEDFEQVRRAHERMEQLIQNLLTLAQRGEALDEVVANDLSATVEDAWANVETGDATWRATGDATVEADRERLTRLLENLIDNAVEHGGEDVTITVGPLERASASADATVVSAPDSAGESEPGGPSNESGEAGGGFYVADDGPGIPEGERERTFEHGHTTSEDGTGLGLAIVRRIAEAHGWTVSVAESDDGGARFEFDG